MPKLLAPEWSPPEATAGAFQFRVGESFLIQFVRDHNFADVLRELVQNEYDAGGSSMRVAFGESSLTVFGTGRGIDRAGWRRLSVMLGTGNVPGAADGEFVEAKQNGLGSKNFGIRTLFLLGDTIFIRSAGKQTVLSIQKGALSAPIDDPSSVGQPGVTVTVPFRARDRGDLPGFGPESEKVAFERFREGIASTLLKLARPDRAKNLTTVQVESARLGCSITWRQRAKEVAPTRWGRVLERAVRVEERSMHSAPTTWTVKETEFQRSLAPPKSVRNSNFPGYFRLPGGRVVVGLGIRFRGRRALNDHPGTVYYPLEAAGSFTGCAVSVNAPFEMDGDRSQPQSDESSPWNAWLSECVSAFAADLAGSDWYERFNGDGFALLAPSGAPSVIGFARRVQATLSTKRAWPSVEPIKRGRRAMHLASDLTIPTVPQLSGFSSASAEMATGVVLNPRAQQLARSCGAPLFTADSLIRLRCAGPDGSALKTKIASGIDSRRYTAFPGALMAPALQRRFSAALDDVPLSDANMHDLRTSPTTLAADGTLAPGAALWVIDPEWAAASAVPAGSQLHPVLIGSRILAGRVAKHFDIGRWALDVGQRSAGGDATDEELRALENSLLSSPILPKSVWTRLRQLPVLRDQHDKWIPPVHLLASNALLDHELGSFFRLARLEHLRSGLVNQLRIRVHPLSQDIIEAATHVRERPDLAEAFELLLKRHIKLLRPSVVAALRDVPFLRSSSGGVASPGSLFIRNPANERVLAEGVAYAAATDRALLNRLACQDRPTTDAIIGRLSRLRDSQQSLPDGVWLDVYRALALARRRERRAVASVRALPVMSLGADWYCPHEILVGPRHRRTFLDLVPILDGERGALASELGASSEPEPAHWVALFEHLSERSPAGGKLDVRERRALRQAMGTLKAPPQGLSASARFLLDRGGRLHPAHDARRSILVLDDFRRLSKALEASGHPIYFADDIEPRTETFFVAAGVKALRSLSRRGVVNVTGDRRQPDWTPRLVQSLHRPYLAPAIERLVSSAHTKRPPRGLLARELAGIKEITFAEKIKVAYRVGIWVVSVDENWTRVTNGLVIAKVPGQVLALRRLAEAVAELATPNLEAQHRFVDSIKELLQCRTAEEMSAFLGDRDINWRWAGPGAIEDDDDADEDELRRRLGDSFESPGPKREPKAGDQKSEDAADATDTKTDPDPLPPLDKVVLEIREGGALAPITDGGGGAGGSGGGGGSLRDAEADARDRALGRRGEELIFDSEVENVVRCGFPAERVVWVSRDNPAADHDIRSVDPDGQTVYVEVKTTAGRHGNFTWPKAEFNQAVRHRKRYILWRVYEGRSTSPIAVPFRDPVGLYLTNGLRMKADSFAAQVEGLEKSTPSSRSVK